MRIRWTFSLPARNQSESLKDCLHVPSNASCPDNLLYCQHELSLITSWAWNIRYSENAQAISSSGPESIMTVWSVAKLKLWKTTSNVLHRSECSGSNTEHKLPLRLRTIRPTMNLFYILIPLSHRSVRVTSWRPTPLLITSLTTPSRHGHRASDIQGGWHSKTT